MYNCPNCEKSYNSINSITKHWSKTHNLDIKSLYLKLNNLFTEPTCFCGCGGELKFLDTSRGFTKYIRGHASRINNNFQSEKSKTNSLNTRQKMLKDGSWKPFRRSDTGTVWNSGLTKNTDERVKKIFDKRDTTEYKKISSERMSEGRKDGSIRTLYGKEHSQWKGGTSSLTAVCYSNKKLFNGWKKKLFESSNYTCSQCGKQSCKKNFMELHVHHDKVKMTTIIRLIAEQEGWEERISGIDSISKLDDENILQLKNKISDLVAEYHINNNISGLVLCKECHKEEHPNLNF